MKNAEKTDEIALDSKPESNQDAIVRHLLDVKRFTGPPVSPLSLELSPAEYDDSIEISREQLQHARGRRLKPMVKNFDTDYGRRKYSIQAQEIYADDLRKELYDFQRDTKDIEHPATFTEYIRMFVTRLVRSSSRLSSGILSKASRGKADASHFLDSDQDQWELHETTRAESIATVQWMAAECDKWVCHPLCSSESLSHGFLACAHTDEFRPLNKYVMSDIAYYFDDDFLDLSGLFQNQKNSDRFVSDARSVVKTTGFFLEYHLERNKPRDDFVMSTSSKNSFIVGKILLRKKLVKLNPADNVSWSIFANSGSRMLCPIRSIPISSSHRTMPRNRKLSTNWPIDSTSD